MVLTVRILGWFLGVRAEGSGFRGVPLVQLPLSYSACGCLVAIRLGPAVGAVMQFAIGLCQNVAWKTRPQQILETYT